MPTTARKGISIQPLTQPYTPTPYVLSGYPFHYLRIIVTLLPVMVFSNHPTPSCSFESKLLTCNHRSCCCRFGAGFATHRTSYEGISDIKTKRYSQGHTICFICTLLTIRSSLINLGFAGGTRTRVGGVWVSCRF